MGRKQRFNLDDPAVHEYRREILQSKRFLNQIYQEWYALVCGHLMPESTPVIELGSGAGFLKDYLPIAFTSDIMFLPYAELVQDAMSLPLGHEIIGSLVLVNTLHHIPDVNRFFSEANRVLKPGGQVLMLEPWITPWSGWVYRNFHQEPMDTKTGEWTFNASGPMSGANQALPWMVFKRDREAFLRQFPDFTIEKIKPIMPITYLLSGGFSSRLSFPKGLFNFFRKLECVLLNEKVGGMFAFILLRKTGD